MFIVGAAGGAISMVCPSLPSYSTHAIEVDLRNIVLHRRVREDR